MTLTRDEQYALVRIERALRTDLVLRAAAADFNLRCPKARKPVHDGLSPWHPMRWRVTCVALVLLSVGFAGFVAIVTLAAAA